MNYYKYIAEYLSKPMTEVANNSQLLFYKDWPGYFIKQFEHLGDNTLNDVVLFVVPNEYFSFKGKNRTNEAHYKQKLILCNQEYIRRGNDPNASFIHNLAHIQQYHQVGEEMFEKYRGERVFKDIDCQYPNNKVELYAFSIELRYLYHMGITGDFFLEFMRQYSDEVCREEFFCRLIKHIYKNKND